MLAHAHVPRDSCLFLSLCLSTSLSPLSVLSAHSFLFYSCLCLSLSPSIFLSLGDTHMSTLAPHLPAQFSTSSHPAMPQTRLAGQLDSATPQRDSPQGWGCWTGQYMSGASCPSLRHTPCNTHCWLRLGYMPRLLSPEPLHRAARLQEAPGIPGRERATAQDSLPLPLHYPGIWAHSLRPPFSTPHPYFLPPHPPFWPLPEPPYLAQVSSSSCPPLVVPRAQAGRDSCGPNSWGQGGERGNLSWRGSLHPQRHPQLRAAVAWEREGGGGLSL